MSYVSARFSIKDGTTGNVRVTLNASGRRLLKVHRSTKVWANVRFPRTAVRFPRNGGAPKSALFKVTR